MMLASHIFKILSVIESCETWEQLNIAYAWGMNVTAIDDYDAHFLMMESKRIAKRKIINSKEDTHGKDETA